MQTRDNGKGELPNPGHVCTRDTTNDQPATNRGVRRAKHRAALRGSSNFRKHTDTGRWSRQEDATLLNFAGEKTPRDLAKLLGRTRRAVYCRLWRLRLSSQLKEGYTLSLLAEDLRVDRARVRQWLLDGKLESQSLQVTRSSVKKLCERGEVEIISKGDVVAVLGRPPERVLEFMERNERKSGRNRRSVGRKRGIARTYTLRRVGKILRISENAVKQLVATGHLRLSRPRIEEGALRKFIEKHPEEINWHLVDPQLLEWLGLRRIDEGGLPSKLPGALRHLVKMWTCPGCLHSFRGNAYWTHLKSCPHARGLEPEVLQWAAEHPRSAIPHSPTRAINTP